MQVTLYLDGVGVPVTQSQRALTTDVAKMIHDYYEVVFWNNNPLVVARTAWEIGQSAGIKGVYRGADPAAGHRYNFGPYNQIFTGNYGGACLFVGRKTDKTLLALGPIMSITDADGTSNSNSSSLYISSSTKSVTFTVAAITTRLYLYNNESVDDYGNNWSQSSFTGLSVISGTAEYVSLGGVQYPYYKLPESNSIVAKYYFRINSNTNITEYGYIRNNDSKKPEIIKREPRFLSGGRYYYVQQAKLDTGTTIIFDPIFPYYFDDVDGDAYQSAWWFFYINRCVPLIFNTSNSQGGIFSFTFRIPVYNLTKKPSIDGVDFTTWYLQPGFGKDLYSLDNGKDNRGGCILMGYKVDFGDWMDIFTAGMPW